MTRPVSQRLTGAQEIIAKLARAARPPSLEPPPPPPTSAEFERLLERFEREFTRAYCTGVWSGTWVEIILLSRRLFADKGDLCVFYARDYAFDLLTARNIEGVKDDPHIRSYEPGDSTVRTIDTIARAYLCRSGRDDIVRNTIFSHLRMVVAAYSPDDTPQLEILNRMIEVLRRNGTLADEDAIYRIRGYAEYHEREDRYARERAKERGGAGSVTPTGCPVPD